MKLGIIGEEMLATAIKLASEHGAEVQALHVIRVPLEQPLDAPLDDEDERAEESLAEARLLGAEHGVTVEGTTVRARAIGAAIVDCAHEVDADLIVLGLGARAGGASRGSSRRPSTTSSARRPCEVLIVAFPQSVMDEELAAT